MHSDLCKAADQLQICTAIYVLKQALYCTTFWSHPSNSITLQPISILTFEVRVSFCQKCKTRAAVHPLHSDHSFSVRVITETEYCEL